MIRSLSILKSAYLALLVLITPLAKGQKYLSQSPPSETPEIFAPEIVSKEGIYEFGSVFTADGLEFFYGVDDFGKADIRYSKWIDGKWTNPQTIISDSVYSYNDPFLSTDENRIYYISNQQDNVDSPRTYDIWYSVRKGDGWSEPINAGSNINTDGNEYYISFTRDGAMYFSSNKGGGFDIYKSPFKSGEFQPASRLPETINTSNYEADVFISPDESFMIFCSTRKEGYGQGDLYISFKTETGSWSESKNMGELINSKNHELCPFVTNDGKYFFYTSNKDIYWVDAKILDQYRD